MNKESFDQKGVHIMVKNISLETQLSWFKDLLPSLCQTDSDCHKLYERSCNASRSTVNGLKNICKTEEGNISCKGKLVIEQKERKYYEIKDKLK